MTKAHKKLSEKRIVIKDPISGYDKIILSKMFRLPNGIIENFFVDEGKDSVQILAITSDNMVVTVKQYRPGSEEHCIELPGGGVEKNEDVLAAAKRELLEETMFEGEEISFLFKAPYSPYSTGERYTFLAWNCKRVEKNLDLDDNEFLKVALVPLNDFLTMAKEGKVRGHDCVYPAASMIKNLYKKSILTDV